MSFQPNVVVIPITWVAFVLEHPDKISDFLGRVSTAYKAQCAAFAPTQKTEADLPLEPPSVPYIGTLRESLTEALAAEFPLAQKPTDAQVLEIQHLTIEQGATIEEAIQATLDLGAKLSAKNADKTSHIRLALIAMRKDGTWDAIKEEADKYREAVGGSSPNTARLRENQRLSTVSAPPPPPPASPQRESRIADILNVARGKQ